MDKYDELADKIWSYAETGFEEYKSAKAMSDFLEAEGFKVENNLAGMPTAYVATYGSGKPVISFLAEYDALSGLSQKADSLVEEKRADDNDAGHGCGHHLLGVGAIIAVVKYKNWLIENNKTGTVKLYGCPGEETGSGKAYLARDGYFNDSDVALTWHPGLYNQVVRGSSMSNIVLFFHFKGIASHAAATPELGRSALDACELTNVGVNYLREHMSVSDRIHYAYIDAGGKAPNVVQADAILKYYVRSKDNPTVKALTERVIDCAKGAALMTGTKLDVVFDEGLSNLVTNETLEKVMEESLIETFHFDLNKEELEYAQAYKDTYDYKINCGIIADCVNDKEKLKDNILSSPVNDYVVLNKHTEYVEPGSTDVGDVSWCVPTAQVNTACYCLGAESHSWQWVAQGKSSVAHKGMKLAGEVLCNAAIKLHENPTLIEEAKEELKQKLNGETYQSLIPKDVKPHLSKI